MVIRNSYLFYYIKLLIVFSLLYLMQLTALVPILHAQTWYGQVVKVLDGDSLMIKRKEKVYEVRLYGIDTPEYGQDYSKRARSFTRKHLLNKIVSVEAKDIDKYGRTVAMIRSQGRLINKELVRAGMAWVYPWFCQEEPICSEMKKIEEKTKNKRRGLWQLADPVPPWKWRDKNKKK